MLGLTVGFWSLVGAREARGVPSDNLVFWAWARTEPESLLVSVEGPDGKWELRLPANPGLRFKPTDAGYLVVWDPGQVSLWSRGELKSAARLSGRRPVVVGESVALVDSQGADLHYVNLRRSQGRYEVLPPLAVSEARLAGVWRGELVLYGSRIRRWPVEGKPTRIELVREGVAVEMSEGVVFYDTSGSRLWAREGARLVGKGEREVLIFAEGLVALSPEGEVIWRIPGLRSVVRASLGGDTLRVFAQDSLYTFVKR